MNQPTNPQSYNVQNVSPLGTTVLVGTSSTQVIGADLGRTGIIFANPGSVTIWLSPGNEAAAVGQGIPLLPGALLKFLNDRLVSYSCGWNAIAASGSSNPLTILDLTSTASSAPVPPITGGLTDSAGNVLVDAAGNVLTDI